MASATFTIAASGDDGRTSADFDEPSFNNSSAFITLSSNTSDTSIGFFRFDNVTIPQGSTINSATLDLVPRGTFADDSNGNIQAVAADDPVAPANAAAIDAWALTSASVSWVADALGTSRVSSPSITTVLQEIVDRGGFASGNAVVVVYTGNTDVNKTFQPDSYDGSPSSDAAELSVDWTEPASGGPTGSPLQSPVLRTFASSPFLRV